MAELTPSERRVARKLVSEYPVAGLVTVAELAELASTSSATVVRLIQKLGFDGYPDFQSTLRSELSVRHSGPIERLDSLAAQWSGPGILNGISESVAKVAQSTSRTVPEAEFEAAVSLLADPSRHIYLMGGRVTTMLADYLEAHLVRLRPGVTVLPRHAGSQPATLLDLGRRDVLLAFDFRRYERETVDAARRAAKRGTRVVLVTDIMMSPAAAIASIVLPVEVETPSPFDTAAAGLVVVEALALATLRSLGESGVKRMQAWDAMAHGGLVAD
jgi:DNA-binding MurR/RpiR family transcriptional regulator